MLSKKEGKKRSLYEDDKGVDAVRNQLIESYQSGVVDELHNNKNIHTFNNRKN